MPVKTLEKDNFIYIAYRRKTGKDFMDFKNVIDSFIKTDSRLRNVIVDLTKNMMITESEINVLCNVIKKNTGTSRTLYIIADKKTNDKLRSIRLTDAAGVMVFDNHLALFTALGKDYRFAP
jgi:hypothetical protein